jgi:phosphoglycolate phosphatase
MHRFATAGWSLAVCTNKYERLSRLLLGALGIADRFAAIAGGDTFAVAKPDPAHLTETIAAASGAPEQSVMIGDSRTDLDTARSAGVAFAGVTFGYTPVPMAEMGPDLLIERFDTLSPEIATRLFRRSGASAGAPSKAATS